VTPGVTFDYGVSGKVSLPCVHGAEHSGKPPLWPDGHQVLAVQVLDGVVAAAVDDAGGEDETLLTEQRALEPQNASELHLGLLQARHS